MRPINADFTRRVVVNTVLRRWQRSPAPGVWRKRLYLSGEAESGPVTSIVRYDKGSRFPSHEHPEGEEVLVLGGAFSDEHGHYPAGTYLLNPPGSRHAPRSDEGAELFVRLCQYRGRERIAFDTGSASWRPRDNPGIAYLALYGEPGSGARMQFERWRAGATQSAHEHTDLIEIYVLDGTFVDEHGRYPARTWIRYPVGSSHAPGSPAGCTLFTRVSEPPA